MNVIFTGHGSLAQAYANQFPCEIYSFRKLRRTEQIELVKNADVIIHNAANLSPDNRDQAERDNVQLTSSIVDLVAEIKPSVRLIYISSMSVLSEETVTMNPANMTPYAWSKFKGEEYLQKSALNNYCILRYSTIFYGDEKKDGLSRLIVEAVRGHEVQLVNSGIARRDFIPVEICAAYLHRIVLAQGNGTCTIASGESFSFFEVVGILRKTYPDIKISDIKSHAGTEVLHRFSGNLPDNVERIVFSLEDYILRFAKRNER